MSYPGFGESVEAEFTEQRSRFIGYSFPVNSEEDAREKIAEIRKKHPFATHVCYAFVWDKAGNGMRFSDDGEPQGTAGVPILEVLKAKGLRESGVAVVRYFGGIKLGAGGLVRAYSHAAALAAEKNTVVETAEAVFLRAEFPYELSDAFRKFAEKEALSGVEYGYFSEVSARFVVRKENADPVREKLVDYLNGKCAVFTEKEDYYRF